MLSSVLHDPAQETQREEARNGPTITSKMNRIISLVPGDLESLCYATPISPHQGLLFNKCTWKKVLTTTLNLFRPINIKGYLKKLSKTTHLNFDSWCCVQKILSNTQNLRETAKVWDIVSSWKKHLPFDTFKALSGRTVPPEMIWFQNPKNLKAGDLVGFKDEDTTEITTAYVHHTLGINVLLYISHTPPVCVYTTTESLYALKPVFLQEEQEDTITDYYRAIEHMETQCVKPSQSEVAPIPIILGATAHPLGSYTATDITLAFAPAEHVAEARARLRARFPSINVYSLTMLKRFKHSPLYR